MADTEEVLASFGKGHNVLRKTLEPPLRGGHIINTGSAGLSLFCFDQFHLPVSIDHGARDQVADQFADCFQRDNRGPVRLLTEIKPCGRRSNDKRV